MTRVRVRGQWKAIAGLLMSLVVISGCNSSVGPDYYKLDLLEVSGKITLDGEPLQGAYVKFVADDTTYSFATTDADGRYQLMLDSQKSGILAGEKTVQISANAPPSEAGGEGEDPEGGDPDAKPKAANGNLPDCYGSKSAIKVTIEKSETDLNIDLKSDCSTTGRS